MTDYKQCIQIVGPTASRRHQCTRKATRGDYCAQHANHPRHRIRERLAALMALTMRRNQGGESG